MSDLHFLPYLRRGLSRHLSLPDPGSGTLAAAEIPMGLTVAGQDVSDSVHLLGPHHVASIAADEIVRRYPTPGARDVEWNFFPLIELKPPDLPWRYTPAGPGNHGRLRPWLTLVVVDESVRGVEYTAGGTLGQLSVTPEASDQLPPINETWGWAHVQSSRPAEEVAAAVEESPETLTSRIVCPRRMEPGRTYRAALVRAFRGGTEESAEPAWGPSVPGTVFLDVFDTWTFTTAPEGGDFESLCELLEPAVDTGELGIRTVDVTRPGIDVGWPHEPTTIELIGALADPAVITDDAPPGNRAFADAVEPILNDGLARSRDELERGDYDALRDDPVVGLPFYGRWPAHATKVPDAGWARGMNVRTDRRIAGGLGARTVRRNQEALMAAAWDQLGSVREASDELNRGRLSAEIGRSWHARASTVERGDRLGLTAPLLTFVRVDGEPARKVAQRSLAPNAIVDRIWLRRTPRARGASASKAYLNGTEPSAGEAELAAFDYRSVAPPTGLYPIEAELVADEAPGSQLSADAIDHIDRTGIAIQVGGGSLSDFIHLDRRTPFVRQPIPRRLLESVEAVSVAADVAAAVAELNPLASTRASLTARIPALATLLPERELPAEFHLTPQFVDALFWDLAAVDDDVIVPGLGEFPNNRVRLLAVNAGFVGAFLIAANHEMARELLWREYPAELSGTFFQRFFDYADPKAVDIVPIDGWHPRSSIAANLPTAASSTVILIRGDLIRRYPDVNVFMVPQNPDGDPDEAGSIQPSFEGRLEADVLVVGFPIAPEVALGESGKAEYFLALEERVTAPRFGLDVERKGVLNTWDELAWTDFAAADLHVSTGNIPGSGASPTFDDIEWGRNAAHQAAAVHQRPYRRLYPATRLVRP